MYRSVSVKSFWICNHMTSVFNPSDAIFLIFYTENRFLHHRQPRFPYKGQLVIAIKEAIYICCDKISTTLWKCKTSLILTVFAVISSRTFPTLSYRHTFQNDGGHDKQNNSFTVSFERLWKVVPAFREGHKTSARTYAKNYISCVTSDFRRQVDENCALVGSYAESSGNFLPTFRDNLSVPPSRVHKLTVRYCSFCCVITQKSAVFNYSICR